MRKYFLLTLLFFMPLISQAQEFKVNEYMNDLYFANGIDTKRWKAEETLDDTIMAKILVEHYGLNESKMEKNLNFKLAYNNTLILELDLLEAINQKKAEHKIFWYGLATFTEVYGKIAKYPAKKLTEEALKEMLLETLKKKIKDKALDAVLDEVELKEFADLLADLRSGVTPKNVLKTLNDSVAAIHSYDLSKQVTSYKNSIKSGHGVIVIAHSQGNFFTNEAYAKIEDDADSKWMLKYFNMISVASPAHEVAKDGAKSITFDNDPITSIPDRVSDELENPMRYIAWINISDSFQGTSPFDCIGEKRVEKSQIPENCAFVGDPYYDFWELIDMKHVDFHAFSYYMNTDISKKIIMDFVKNTTETHQKASSQWNYIEKNKDTKEYRIKVTHFKDSSLNQYLQNKEIYPFNVDKKLYYVPNPNDPQNDFQYVKASFGGEKILDAEYDTWDNQEDEQFYKLEGTNPAEYIEGDAKVVYLYAGRNSSNINSIQLYMSDGEKSVLVYPDPNKEAPFKGIVICDTCDGPIATLVNPTSIGDGFKVSDGAYGYPAAGTYDRYLNSKWVGTKYEGFRDLVLAVIPFTKESGFWCNNTRGGNCKLGNNFITNYSLNYNDYIDNIYKENFLGESPSQ